MLLAGCPSQHVRYSLRLAKLLLCVVFFGPHRDPVRLGEQEHPSFTDGRRLRAREVGWPEAPAEGLPHRKEKPTLHIAAGQHLRAPLPFLEMRNQSMGKLGGPQVVCFLWLCCAYLA